MTHGGERRWLVMKFGGTSVSDVARWETICDRVRKARGRGYHMMIVVSALSGVTDLLASLGRSGDLAKRLETLAEIESLHERLLQGLDLRPGDDYRRAWRDLADAISLTAWREDDVHRARVLSAGEKLSSAIGCQLLRKAGLETRLQDATTLLTASNGPSDSPLSTTCAVSPSPVLESGLAAQGDLHITQGWLAQGPAGQTWLLGRGGSDTSAACVAVALEAERLEIWTDVPGIFSANPAVVPDARLLNYLSFSEAQELASMGAKILHPPSVRICQTAGIPISIRDTGRPGLKGTGIGPRNADTDAQLKGVVSRSGIVLVLMENPGMWRQVGFLADAFDRFRRCGLSIDLISTSESSVTVSLDPGSPVAADQDKLDQLVDSLSSICEVQLRTDCVSISLVGNAIRTILGRLAEALDVFQDRKVHMVTQSANDLNLTLVVDAGYADRLVQNLHRLLISPQATRAHGFGGSWTVLTQSAEPPAGQPWWHDESAALECIMAGRGSAYVYHLGTVRQAVRRLTGLDSLDRVLYAVKANNHPRVLSAVFEVGAGFECVSLAEVRHVLECVPGAGVEDVLLTPNFAARQEYAEALALGVQITIDNPYPLAHWPDLFAGKEIFLRIDLEVGYGHNRRVITAGARSKFGIAIDQLASLTPLLTQHRIRVTGLHAHTGSGVLESGVWAEQLRRMMSLLPLFPAVRVIDLGGGLGVPERRGQAALDLDLLERKLGAVAGNLGLAIWLEPGRYLVAESGVLLSRVTQLKTKGRQHYLGIETGMNSMIRPALYGAHHDIVNLSRLRQPATHRYTIVGPICESGDVLGEGRYLPESAEGDIMLLANAGAYGHVMSSSYNQREPAVELIFETEAGER